MGDPGGHASGNAVSTELRHMHVAPYDRDPARITVLIAQPGKAIDGAIAAKASSTNDSLVKAILASGLHGFPDEDETKESIQKSSLFVLAFAQAERSPPRTRRESWTRAY